jgi:lysophospholipase L1-like esterase
MLMKHGLIALVCAAALAAPSAFAATSPSWLAVWAAPPAPTAPTAPAARGFENQTIRQVLRVSADGRRVRIRLTNEYGADPLAIGAATIAHATEAGASTSTPIALTFGGQPSVVIPARGPIYSDPVDLPVKALESLSVSVYFPGKTGPCTCHGTGIQTAYISAPGDFTKADFTPASTAISRLFLSEVQVQGSSATKAIIPFGDSITDGYRSTENANRRWPDILANRLGGKVAVTPEAISGNRVLSFGNPGFGDAALSRLDRDVLAVPGAAWVVVLEGVNDLGAAQRPTMDQLVSGYRQIIDRAHSRGLKVYGATILPYEGAAYFSADGENTRQKVNAWMRSKDTAFDGLIDFDKAMADPAHPAKMRADLQSGDWLHPNDAGYKVMGDAVDLKLFR